MRFLSERNLKLYWKDEQGGQQNIIDLTNTRGQFELKSRIINVSASANVSNQNNYEI